MEEMYYYWLHNVEGVGNRTIKKIVERVSPKELYESGCDRLSEYLTVRQKKKIEESRRKWDLHREWEKLSKSKIFLTYFGAPSYPEKLMTIPDPPMILYGRGKAECFHRPAVAVIGARACSAYGKLAARELGKELARNKIVVVSGMARGIDSVCQWAALEEGGESIAVLGSGVQVCYPRENYPLYERLQMEGCILAESIPGTPPAAGLFPPRNRIISGLADIIVVIEAREKSGTFITVDMALEQGKEVYCLPGRITDSLSRGCNHLIKTGAGLLLSPKEFVEEICPTLLLSYQPQKVEEPILSEEEKELLSCIDITPKSLEEIWLHARQKQPLLKLPECMELLLKLRIKERVREQGQYYYRMDLGSHG